ncbi:hypothetical protein [Lysinibacillus parviboronicapiens]|nr:hypothetical protein [Lysinibacillus parviboronicapiens]
MDNFTAEEKIFIARLYLEGKHSYLGIQDLYKVSYPMIKGWYVWYVNN